MAQPPADFTGSIPQYYDRIMGPAQFDAFGAELARRLPAKPPGDVLEVACGTGRVTRYLRERLSAELKVFASDISAAMLEYARGKLAAQRGVEWREADACKLPFGDAAFGAVVCAFGVMFVPDKRACFREARRVLREGGTFLFNVWDGLENNPHGRVAAEVIEGLLPGDPAAKFGSIPYHFNDRAAIRSLLDDAGFAVERIDTVRIACTCPSAREFATGQVRGTPRSLILTERGLAVDRVIEQVAAALARFGGAEPFRYTAQALVVEARAI
jgi:SAM-dependent methyltransferase